VAQASCVVLQIPFKKVGMANTRMSSGGWAVCGSFSTKIRPRKTGPAQMTEVTKTMPPQRLSRDTLDTK